MLWPIKIADSSIESSKSRVAATRAAAASQQQRRAANVPDWLRGTPVAEMPGTKHCVIESPAESSAGVARCKTSQWETNRSAGREESNS